MNAMPTWIEAAILVFGTFRLVRLVGWDDFPPVERTRDWIMGAQYNTVGTTNSNMHLTDEVPNVTVVYSRPAVAKLIQCPWCQGFWVSLLVYLIWLAAPEPLLVFLGPWALSGAVGLIAKNLDP